MDIENFELPVAICDAKGAVTIANQALPLLVANGVPQLALFQALFQMIGHLLEEVCEDKNPPEYDVEIKEAISGRHYFDAPQVEKVLITIISFDNGLGRRYGDTAADKFYFGGFAFKYQYFEPERPIEWEQTQCIPVLDSATGIEISLQYSVVANIAIFRRK